MTSRVVIIRFGHDWDETCMLMDEVRYKQRYERHEHVHAYSHDDICIQSASASIEYVSLNVAGTSLYCFLKLAIHTVIVNMKTFLLILIVLLRQS